MYIDSLIVSYNAKRRRICTLVETAHRRIYSVISEGQIPLRYPARELVTSFIA